MGAKPSRYRYLVDFLEENESWFAVRLADIKRACVLTCVWKAQKNITVLVTAYMHTYLRACVR